MTEETSSNRTHINVVGTGGVSTTKSLFLLGRRPSFLLLAVSFDRCCRSDPFSWGPLLPFEPVSLRQVFPNQIIGRLLLPCRTEIIGGRLSFFPGFVSLDYDHIVCHHSFYAFDASSPTHTTLPFFLCPSVLSINTPPLFTNLRACVLVCLCLFLSDGGRHLRRCLRGSSRTAAGGGGSRRAGNRVDFLEIGNGASDGFGEGAVVGGIWPIPKVCV